MRLNKVEYYTWMDEFGTIQIKNGSIIELKHVFDGKEEIVKGRVIEISESFIKLDASSEFNSRTVCAYDDEDSVIEWISLIEK